MFFTIRIYFMSVLLLLAVSHGEAGEYMSGITWEEPPVVTPGDANHQPPSDAVILFDGTNLDAWENVDLWKIEEGALVVGKKYARTKQKFGDFQLHLEWSAPTPAKGKGQGRGNSGLFLGVPTEGEGSGYEIQILDSYENTTYPEGQAGAIYKQTPPMANACRPPGEWNTYNVFWTAPRFKEDGALESPAVVTVMHNGVLILNRFELLGDTPYQRPPQYVDYGMKGHIALQDHRNPVRFRNIWLREMVPPTGTRTSEPYIREGKKKIPLSIDK